MTDDETRRARTLTVPPLALAAAAAGLQLALPRRAATPASTAAATLATGLAAWFLVEPVLRFRRNGTTVDPTSPSAATTLVTTGANAISRNPMYVGMAGALVAHALARRSWTALVPAAAFVVTMTRGQIATEERALVATFGHDYEEYSRRVPRWLDARSLRTLATRAAEARAWSVEDVERGRRPDEVESPE